MYRLLVGDGVGGEGGVGREEGPLLFMPCPQSRAEE